MAAATLSLLAAGADQNGLVAVVDDVHWIDGASLQALATFEDLGATPWAERARDELRACGARPRRRARGPTDELSAHELRVAQVVAAGATNKEAASALFLSAKTIDFHLQNVYRKLGVSSRTQLANRLPADVDVGVRVESSRSQ